jgi:hypothetical protein
MLVSKIDLLAISGFTKSTLFDYYYFRVLLKALCYKNFKAIKKYFFMRSKYMQFHQFRINMRQLFIFLLPFCLKNKKRRSLRYSKFYFNWILRIVLFGPGLAFATYIETFSFLI